MKINLLTNTIIIIATIFITSCSKDTIKEPEHHGKIQSNINSSSFVPSYINQDDMSKFDSTNIGHIENMSAKEIEATLRPFISQTFIDQFQGKQKMKEILASYNNALLELIKNTPKEITNILSRYYKLVFTDCNDNLYTCINIKFFNRDYNNSSLILLHHVRQMDTELLSMQSETKSNKYKNTIKKYYLYLDLISELKNSRNNINYDSLYIKYSFDYSNILKEENKEAELIGHNRIFTNKLQNIIKASSNELLKVKKDLLRTINQFAPCNFSRKSNSQENIGTSELLSLSSDLKGNDLQKCFANNSKSELNNKNYKKDHIGNSFVHQMDIINQKHSSIIKHMNMEYIPSLFNNHPAYLYIIDRIFRGHWSETDTQELTEKMNLDTSKMLEIAEAYLKYELISSVIKTNKTMHELYYNDSSVTSLNIYQKAIIDNTDLVTIWQDFRMRKDILKRFVLFSVNKDWRQDLYSHYQTIFSSIDKNIKYISSVPQIMLLAYKMAQKEFSIDVMGFFQMITIDSTSIIKMFFSGEFPLWFNFVDDTTPLKKMELLYAFDFALRTQIFDNFTTSSIDQSKIISPKDFFNVVISRYLQDTKETVTKLEEAIEGNNKRDLDNFYKICNGQKYQESIPLDKLVTQTLLGKVSPIADFHSGTILYDVKSIRTRLTSELTFVKNMVDIYNSHYPNSTEKVDTEIQTIKIAISNIYKGILSFETKTSECTFKILREEFKQQKQIINMEKEYIKTVFDKMLEIQESATEQQKALAKDYSLKLNQLNLSTILNRDINPETEIFDRINGDYYFFSRLGFLGRMINYLGKINPNISIDIPSMMKYNNLYKKDKSNIIHSVFLPSSGSYEERLSIFTRKILSKIGSGPQAIAQWLKKENTTGLDYMSNKLFLLVEVLKAKELGMFKSEQLQITPQHIIDETLKVAKLLSLSGDDIELLEDFNINFKYSDDLQKRLFFKSKTEPLTILEKVYEKIVDIKNITDEIDLFMKQIVLNTPDMLFLPASNIKGILKNNYAPLIKNSFSLIKDFHSAVKKTEKKHTQLYIIDPNHTDILPAYVYKVDIDGNNHLQIDTISATDEVNYLNKDKIKNTKKIISNFHIDTLGEFKPEENK